MVLHVFVTLSSPLLLKPELLWSKFHFDILHVFLSKTLNWTLFNTDP